MHVPEGGQMKVPWIKQVLFDDNNNNTIFIPDQHFFLRQRQTTRENFFTDGLSLP